MSDIEKIKDDLRRTGFHAAAVAIEAIESLERQLASVIEERDLFSLTIDRFGATIISQKGEIERVTGDLKKTSEMLLSAEFQLQGTREERDSLQKQLEGVRGERDAMREKAHATRTPVMKDPKLTKDQVDALVAFLSAQKNAAAR